MRIKFIGSGDAFGSGGRLNTCFHVVGEKVNFLIDCGASSLIGLKAHKVSLNDIQVIFVTHFHADHFGGIPFFMLNAQFFSKRTEPLSIVGPPSLSKWYERVMETAFPGSSKTKPKFDLSLIALEESHSTGVSDIEVIPFQAKHGAPDGPFFSYRLTVEDRVIAYTGDTEWTEELVQVGANADLLIAEAYFFEKEVKFHLSLDTLLEHLPLIQPKRLIFTHMSDDMLNRLGTFQYETAHDGKIVEF